MEFCDECGSAMVSVDDQWVCRSCNPDAVSSSRSTGTGAPDPRHAPVADLPTTDSGAVRKKDAVDWLSGLDRPSDRDLRRSIVPKPSDFSGSTYPTSISNIRVTGDPKFIQTVAGLFEPLLEFEGSNTRLEVNLQETEDRDSGELTGNFALYLSVARRS